MSSYLRFFLSHPRTLGFGILLTLFSSFGQTFLISIFVPKILAELGLSTGGFGALYACATIGSALSLPFFGRLLDRMDLRRYAVMVGLGLMLSCFVVAAAPNPWVLFGGLLGLRLTGQGLLSLTASTTMARLFTENRGRALSVSGLGYPLGEGLLPLAVVLLINAVGWRISWIVLGGFTGLVMLPLIVRLLRHAESPHGAPSSHPAAGMEDQPVAVWRDPRFYLLIPGTLALPVILTGLFLYQIPLADFKGWTAGTMATAFIGFAAARMVCGLAIRWGALRIFPFSLLPLCAGLAMLLLQGGAWPAYAFLALAGISQGCAGAIMTTLWVELYGRAALGSVKSVVAMLGVLGTAISPIIIGWLLQSGVTFGNVLPACVVLAFAAFLLSFGTQRWLARDGESAFRRAESAET